MERLYEVMYVLDPDLSDTETDEAMQRAAAVVEQVEGRVQHNYVLGSRDLAYEINKRTRGTYCLMYFTGTGATVDALKQEFVVDQHILRGMVVLSTPKTVWEPGRPAAAAPQAQRAEAEEVAEEVVEEEAPETEQAEAGEATSAEEGEPAEPAADASPEEGPDEHVTAPSTSQS